MAKTGSPLKAKMPKVKQHNKLQASDAQHRANGDYRVFLDVPYFPTITESGARYDYAALGKIPVDGGPVPDDLGNVWDVLSNLGIAYDQICKVPVAVSELVDETVWIERVVKNIAKCAGTSPRCAVIDDGTDEGAVVIEHYTGPSNGECFSDRGYTVPVTVFYPSICKVADPSFGIERDKDTGIAQAVRSALPIAKAMSAGISKLVGRTRADLIAEAARKVTTVHSLEALMESDLELTPAYTHKMPWASDCTVTKADGTSVTVPAHDGFTSSPERIRVAGVEYLEAGSKRETRPADEAALQWASYVEMLSLIADENVRKTAAFLLILKSQDSLTAITEMEEHTTRGGRNGVQDRRTMKPGEIANEWKDLLAHTDIPFTRYYVQKALIALAQARDVMYAMETLDFDLETPTAAYLAAHKALMSPTVLALLNLHPHAVQQRATGKVEYRPYMLDGDVIALHKMRGDMTTNIYQVKVEGLTALLAEGGKIQTMVKDLLVMAESAQPLVD